MVNISMARPSYQQRALPQTLMCPLIVGQGHVNYLGELTLRLQV